MEKVKKIGGDIGNDTCKIQLEEPNYEGKVQFEVMNMVAEGYNRRVRGKETGHLLNLLDVNVYADNKDLGRYFVGGLAFKENRGDEMERTKLDKKATNIDSIIILMTSIAYSLYDPNKPVKAESIALGTLLPTEEYFGDGLIDKFEANFKKNYRVKFNSPNFNNAEITINIIDHEIQPEGTAGHLACIYNLDGSVKEEMKNFEKETYLGIFIGSITTEVSLFSNGEFEPKGFFGFNIGTSDPLDKIIADLGIEMSRHQMDYYIRNNKDLVINDNGEVKDITKNLNEAAVNRFNYTTRLIINKTYKKLSSNGINTKLINRVNLGGGGGITVFDNFKDNFGVGNVHLAKDARYKNAEGALLSIILKQKEQEAAADEVLS